MRKLLKTIISISVLFLITSTVYSFSFPFSKSKFKEISPENDLLKIQISKINDGKAHYYKTKAKDGTMVSFFLLKSNDNVIRAAIDSCDVCYRSGKGYIQDGDHMVCTNCGRRFVSDKINEVKGGCNPAPLERIIEGDTLVISMADINKNSWYCSFKKQ